jgi:hypothetical protein
MVFHGGALTMAEALLTAQFGQIRRKIAYVLSSSSSMLASPVGFGVVEPTGFQRMAWGLLVRRE